MTAVPTGVDPRAACIIGVAQRTWHLEGDAQAPEPLAMATEVLRAAADDAGARGDVLGAVDRLDAVHCMSWPYDDLPGQIAQELAIDPRVRAYSTMGGTTPQRLVSASAAAIGRGEADVAVVVGAEALDTKRRLKRAGERPAWSHRAAVTPPFDIDLHPSEVAHQVFQAWLTFALRDVARRAHLGVAPEAYREGLGRLLAPMTEVAAANPHAWFGVAHGAEELITPSPSNRMVGYPYTKDMVAIMDVDMAAAVVVASQEAADRLGVPVDRRVYLRGGAIGHDATYVAEHPDLWRSPAMGRVLPGALGRGRGRHRRRGPPRPLLVLRLVAAVRLRRARPRPLEPAAHRHRRAALRRRPGQQLPLARHGHHGRGAARRPRLVRPGHRRGHAPDRPRRRRLLHHARAPDHVGRPRTAAPRRARLAVADAWDGPGSVATCSVVHDRDGTPSWGVVVADLPGRAPGPTGGSRTPTCWRRSRPTSGSVAPSPRRPARTASTG